MNGKAMEKLPKKTTGLTGRYLYAIVTGAEDRAYGSLGINGGRVYTIANGNISAIVSDALNQKIRPERRHFAAHQGVLKKVMESSDLLPISFGMISSGPKAVRGVLARNREAISIELERVAGKVEMGLRVSWDVPNIFDFMIKVHSELLEARDRLLNPQREVSQADKIELGQLFEQLLSSDRDRHAKKVERVLSPACFEIKRNKCRDERDVMNLACLVARGSLGDFESAVLKAANFFDDNYAFDYNGPWAPHNFVDVNLNL